MCETANEFDLADDLPTVEPTAFDLIVVGTGLQESILAGYAPSSQSSIVYLISKAPSSRTFD
jgi:hypothetical protein